MSTLNLRGFDVEKYLSTWGPYFNVESMYIPRRISYVGLIDVDYVYSTGIQRCRSRRHTSDLRSVTGDATSGSEKFMTDISSSFQVSWDFRPNEVENHGTYILR